MQIRVHKSNLKGKTFVYPKLILSAHELRSKGNCLSSSSLRLPSNIMFIVPSPADYKPLQIPYFYQNATPGKHKVTQASNCLYYSSRSTTVPQIPNSSCYQRLSSNFTIIFLCNFSEAHQTQYSFVFLCKNSMYWGKKIGKFGILRCGPTRTCYLLAKDPSQTHRLVRLIHFTCFPFSS